MGFLGGLGHQVGGTADGYEVGVRVVADRDDSGRSRLGFADHTYQQWLTIQLNRLFYGDDGF